MQDRTLGATRALVELVVRGTRAGLRDRVLLDVCLQLARAPSGAAWRTSGGAPWSPVLSRGPRAELPPEPALRSCLATGASPAGCRIVRASAPDRGLAIVLGGDAHAQSAEDEAAADEIEALLAAVIVLEGACDADAGPPGPFPARAGATALHHDVRNALTSLAATEQVLARFGAELPAPDRERFEAAIDRECRRAGALIAGALRLRPPAEADVASAAQIARDVVAVEGLARRASEGEIHLHVAAPAEGVRPPLDPADWSRLVRNLVVNALEASEGGPRQAGRIRIAIGLEAGADEPCLSLRVEDRGVGLPPLAIGKVLRPGVSWGKVRGTGQGLAVVAELVRAARGTLLVERLPRGSCFHVWMPVSAAQPAPVAP